LLEADVGWVRALSWRRRFRPGAVIPARRFRWPLVTLRQPLKPIATGSSDLVL